MSFFEEFALTWQDVKDNNGDGRDVLIDCAKKCIIYRYRHGGHLMLKSETAVLLAFCLRFSASCRLVCVPFPLVSGAGCGIRLYRFLIIAVSSTLFSFSTARH